MDLKLFLSKVCNKKDAIRVADYIVSNPDSLSEFIDLVIDNNKAYSHRASWALNTLSSYDEIDLQGYRSALVELFASDQTLNSILRNLLHVFKRLELGEELDGIVLNRCFGLLEDPQTEAAIQCLSVQAIYEIGLEEPILLNELKSLMQFLYENASAAFKANIRKYLKLIERNKLVK
jgi:hypothetical protein